MLQNSQFLIQASNMSKKISLFCFFLSLCLIVKANERESMELYYITYDRTTPVRQLCETLSLAFDSSCGGDKNVYFYLPNADSPIVVKASYENRDQLEYMLSKIRSGSCNVFPDVDITRICRIFNEDDFISDDGVMLYGKLSITFYLCPSFWVNGYNETLISKLLFILDTNQLDAEHFSLDLYKSSEDAFEYDENNLFGSQKLCRTPTFIMTY